MEPQQMQAVLPRDPETQAVLDARAAHKDPQRFEADPAPCSAFADLPACAEKLDADHDEALRSLELDDDVDQGPLFDAPRTPGYGFDHCGWKR
jgi:hypothetical protein